MLVPPCATHSGSDAGLSRLYVVNDRVEVLTFHFLLPGVGNSKEKHINEFVVGQLLVGAKVRRTKRNLLKEVDGHEILGARTH